MPIALRDKNAAKELDMPVSEFLRLVETSALPQPITIGGNKRWLYKDIEAIVSGNAASPIDDIE